MYAAISFGVAHTLYISSFGFAPLNLLTAVPVFTIEFCVVGYLYPFIDEPAMKIVLPSYMTILFVMVWRSIVKFDWFDVASIFGSMGMNKTLNCLI
jgi:hypothetical protein